jgi:hypothetical protein
VGVAFAELLGTASNLAITTDTSTLAGLQADPAYRFSVLTLDGVKTKYGADYVISELKNAAASSNPLGYIANLIAADDAQNAGRTYVITSVPNPDGAGKIYALDGVNKPELTLVRGAVYVFDQSDASNVTHQIAFKDANELSYTTGVVTTGIAGQAGAKTVLTLASDAPEGLRYYCVAHGNGMGNTIEATGGAESYFVADALSDQAYGDNFTDTAASYFNTSAIDSDIIFTLYDHSFDEALAFAGVTLVGTTS